MLKFALLYGVLAILTGCRAVDVLNRLVPSETYTRELNIAYGEMSRQALDIYQPLDMGAQEQGRDVVIFVYGGSWQMGSKDDYTFIGEYFASKGYVTVIPDYRLYPEVMYPAFLQDTAKAVAWSVKHIKEHGGNPERIFLMGHSAGAYNVVSVALRPEFLSAEGTSVNALRGVIGIAGPYDFLPLTDSALKRVFDVPDRKLTQPIHYASGKHPPMLLITGTADDTVSPRNTKRLTAALEAAGSPVTTLYIKGVGHYRIASGLSTPLENERMTDGILNFMHAQ